MKKFTHLSIVKFKVSACEVCFFKTLIGKLRGKNSRKKISLLFYSGFATLQYLIFPDLQVCVLSCFQAWADANLLFLAKRCPDVKRRMYRILILPDIRLI